MILGIILIFLAFISIGIHLSRRDTGIELHDQIIQERGKQLKTSKQQYYIIGFIIGILIGFILTGNFFLTFLGGIAGSLIIGEKLYKNKEQKRLGLLSEQYTQVLSSIISSLEAGSNPYQALEETTISLTSPAKDIFLEILRKNRTGTNYHEAIAIMSAESGWKELKQIEVAFRLYDTSGSDLVVVFNHLLQTAFETKADRKYIDGITSQIRMTAFVLSGMPFFLMGVMRFMSPEFAYPLFNEPTGIIMIIVIFILVIMGNKIVNKMVESIY